MKNTDSVLAELMCRVQDALGPDLREEIASLLAQNRAHQVKMPRSARGGAFSSADLARDGYLPLGRVLDQATVSELVHYLKGRQVYAAHVPVYSDGKARSVAATKAISPYGSYKLIDVLNAPGVLDLALRDDVVALAAQYLEAPPYIYSAHAWWTYAGKPTPALTHGIHRDQDDYRFLSLFVYLTDVDDEKDGPTIYYTGTHRKDSLARCTVNHPNPTVRALAGRIGNIDDFFPPHSGNAYHLSGDLRQMLKSEEVVFTGPAGSGFIADTFGFHSGSPPVEKDRLVLWIRFGLYKNLAYSIDRTEPVCLPPDKYANLTKLQRELLELLVVKSKKT